MKVNSYNQAQSFGKIVIEPGRKTRIQSKTINKILKSKNLTRKLVDDLENLNTDIYITPCSNGEAVKLKLSTDIDFFGMTVVPYDGRYNSKMETIINPIRQTPLNVGLAISNFFKRAKDMDLGSDKNLKLVNNTVDGDLFGIKFD